MRKDYDEIKRKFENFISIWFEQRVQNLYEVLKPDLYAYLSVSQNKDGAMHTLSGVHKFIQDMPKSSHVTYEIGNYICRLDSREAQQVSQVSCIMENENKEVFKFIAIFANHWGKKNDQWLIEEMRMDLHPYESARKDEFEKNWYFENTLAILSPTVHFPCIFPEMDSPYYQFKENLSILSEEEKIEECFYKFLYGIDWIMFTYVKDTLSDDFKNDDKHHFIAYQKFIRQRFHYHSSGYKITDVHIDGNQASAIAQRLVPNKETLSIQFVRDKNEYKILQFMKEDRLYGEN